MNIKKIFNGCTALKVEACSETGNSHSKKIKKVWKQEVRIQRKYKGFGRWMNYNEAMLYIEQLNKVGSIFGLERIRELVRRLGHPERALKIIHIAGTNGKGSFGAFLGKILECAGYRTGRYISPVIEDYCERIQINGQWINQDSVAEILTEIQAVCRTMETEGYEYPTVFEIETAMAFVYFKRADVDFVLLEVGLGGQSDSTNVIEESILSVLTSIGLDHTAVLGDTLEAIAGEKAGIIKSCQDVLSYPQENSAMQVIQNKCLQCESLLDVCDWKKLKITAQTLNKQQFEYKDFKNLQISMPGNFQIYNSAAAVAAAQILIRQGYDISRQAIYDGLWQAKWPGRFEVVHQSPLIIVDGAHNPDGAQKLGQSIACYLKGKKIIYVAGVFADKDYDGILKILAPYADTIFTHQPPTGRGLDAKLLAQTASKYYKNVTACADISEALRGALEIVANAADDCLNVADKAKSDNLTAFDVCEDDRQYAIVAFGSLSTIKGLKMSIYSKFLHS